MFGPFRRPDDESLSGKSFCIAKLRMNMRGLTCTHTEYNFNVIRSADSNQIACFCFVVYLVKVEFLLCFF